MIQTFGKWSRIQSQAMQGRGIQRKAQKGQAQKATALAAALTGRGAGKANMRISAIFATGQRARQGK